ncbi:MULTISPECIES: GGDEF domain-containing protein [Caballeronia]|jgi:diguanylate cyclase (GGDEF)-like protein|uniref:Diguanylate cyclase n=2 Tax=Caballeronia TaxID=1827195 RepID=A0A656QGV4_9BURK|nr:MULTISPECIES: GGDEF domain-containing protein [Caballeronia]EKS69247.1 diguanylate cyclase [Burkholderia sp. SJ98]MDR5794363.1 GGDEF domain-containing protein [Caballeronia sp. LZ008]KDR29165.1 diguanylate cyclase [Caballeronia zhejiangensis]MCG7405041.1 GGDEF domain-containing protein [Caballeronia zhejiangensis]MCI1041619.1 GGDEF domain-containing protein [Caballeronia zhejiangensis]
MEQAHQPARRTYAFAWSEHRNPEREQATLRVWMGAVVLLAYGVFAWLRPSHDAFLTTRLVALYVSYGAITLLIVSRMSAPSVARLTVTTIADQTILGLALAAGGATALPLLWVMFWFLIGSGCRYGKRTLAVSCATALIIVTAMAVWQPWWHENLPAAIGLALSVLGASVYLSVLVDRLGNANRDLARQASTDPLTGLSNRYALERVVDRAMNAPEANGDHATALLLIDLDGFKEVNDTYGHAVGDLLLQAFADSLAKRMRKSDTIARLGGDEFVVLAHQMRDRDAVLSVADNIHSALGEITSVQERPVSVSASIGACLLSSAASAHQTGMTAVLRAADRAMYRAKSLGEGKTVFAETRDFEIS